MPAIRLVGSVVASSEIFILELFAATTDLSWAVRCCAHGAGYSIETIFETPDCDAASPSGSRRGSSRSCSRWARTGPHSPVRRCRRSRRSGSFFALAACTTDGIVGRIDPVSASTSIVLGQQAVAAGRPLGRRSLAVAVDPLRAEPLERDPERVVGAVGGLDAADDVEVADRELQRLDLLAGGVAGLGACLPGRPYRGPRRPRRCLLPRACAAHRRWEVRGAEAGRVRRSGHGRLAGRRAAACGRRTRDRTRQQQRSMRARTRRRVVSSCCSSLGVVHARSRNRRTC